MKHISHVVEYQEGELDEEIARQVLYLDMAGHLFSESGYLFYIGVVPGVN